MEEESRKGKYIGFTASSFDLLHPGHVLMLKECKDVCDYLIVGLHVDPSQERFHKNRPIQSVTERYIQLKGCKFVDEIIPYETEADLHNLLATLPIKVRILGEEKASTNFSGKSLCASLGIDIHFNRREHNYSSSSLRQRIVDASNS